VRRGIGAELDARSHRARIDFEHAVQIFRGVDHHRDVHALAVLRRAAAAHQDGRVVLTADLDRSDDIVRALRQHHPDRHLTVVRGIARIRGAAAVVEPHFAADALRELAFERLGIHFDCRWTGGVNSGRDMHAGILTCAVAADRGPRSGCCAGITI
jgi:hypothetical protein